MAQGCGWQPCGLASHDGEGHWDILTATKIQKKVTEKCGLERASSRFRAMTPPRTAETPAITSTTCGAWAAEAASPGEQGRAPQGTQNRVPLRLQAGWGGREEAGGGAVHHVEMLRTTSRRE